MEEEVKENVDTQAAESEGKVASVVKKLPQISGKPDPRYILGIVLVVLAGVGTGWFLSGGAAGQDFLGNTQTQVPGVETSENEAGIADESTFRDTAEGLLEKGGIEGEGTHHLVREGGESQNVYLTSTVIDLQGFAGKKVQVWGETISARTAGWLMDVGKVKVTE